MSQKICIITGEASGDLHGSALAVSLKKMDPSIRICGSGGNQMKPLADSGFVDSAHLNATGITEVLSLLPAYLKLFKTILNLIENQKPDCVIFVDNPGLNLRIASRLHKQNIPLYYYICPQVWAWNSKRVHKLKKWFRSLYVIFEFETKFFKTFNVNSTFVGHPLATKLRPFIQQVQTRPLNKEIRKVLLLPGSRTHEIERLLPEMLVAVQGLNRLYPGIKISIIESETVSKQLYDRLLSPFPEIERIHQVNKHHELLRSDLAICCSGTATLECAMLGLPMIIIYKSSFTTVTIARWLVKIKYIGLPNLLGDEMVCEELLQENCTGASILKAAESLILNPEKLHRLSSRLIELTSPLIHHNAPEETAKDILQQLQRS